MKLEYPDITDADEANTLAFEKECILSHLIQSLADVEEISRHSDLANAIDKSIDLISAVKF